jgi:hypothetical protein
VAQVVGVGQQQKRQMRILCNAWTKGINGNYAFYVMNSCVKQWQ